MISFKEILAAIAAIFTIKQVKETFAPKAEGFNELYKKYGAKYKVDWKLIKAIAQTESSENANAVNPSDPSYGLMQVLCTGGEVCQNKFPAIPEWVGMTRSKLLDPDTNVMIGTQILAYNIKTYGLEKGVAVYNNWSARNQSTPFSNQAYVDKVMSRYNNLKNEQ